MSPAASIKASWGTFFGTPFLGKIINGNWSAPGIFVELAVVGAYVYQGYQKFESPINGRIIHVFSQFVRTLILCKVVVCHSLLEANNPQICVHCSTWIFFGQSEAPAFFGWVAALIPMIWIVQRSHPAGLQNFACQASAILQIWYAAARSVVALVQHSRWIRFFLCFFSVWIHGLILEAFKGKTKYSPRILSMFPTFPLKNAILGLKRHSNAKWHCYFNKLKMVKGL